MGSPRAHRNKFTAFTPTKNPLLGRIRTYEFSREHNKETRLNEHLYLKTNYTFMAGLSKLTSTTCRNSCVRQVVLVGAQRVQATPLQFKNYSRRAFESFSFNVPTKCTYNVCHSSDFTPTCSGIRVPSSGNTYEFQPVYSKRLHL